jgi:hypothetical protein
MKDMKSMKLKILYILLALHVLHAFHGENQTFYELIKVYHLTNNYVASSVKNEQNCASYVSRQFDFDPDFDFDENKSLQMA